MYQFKKNFLRYIMQFGILAVIVLFFFKAFGNESFDPEAYCPFGGAQTLATYFVQGSMACSMTMVQIMMGVALLVGVVLFGRLFCSYICPLGVVNEFFFKLRSKLKIKGIVITKGSIADKALRSLKYILLFTIFYMTLSSSELFCKNFDPYYAFATGFKGELTVWMATISIVVLLLGSLVIDMFWCKYICPLGAISNIFKFTVMVVAAALIDWVLYLCGVLVPWWVLLAVVVVLGYILEVVKGKAEYNISMLHVHKDLSKCNGCGLCTKKCPYNIDFKNVTRITDVDCTLCGECVASCNKDALKIGICNTRPGQKRVKGMWIPFVIVVALFALALKFGGMLELPTIDLRWMPEGVTEEQLSSVEVEGLRSVKCYGSSMAFKAQVSKLNGVYGVKTFVKHGRVVIYYLPSLTNEEKIREGIFTPSKFRIQTPDNSIEKIKVVTIRTENMHDKMDINYLGLQFRALNREFYGIESQYDCPIIVRLYMGINEQVDEKMLKQVVEMKELDMPQHGGGSKKIPCNYKFVKIEEGVDTLALRPYLERMFPSFNADFIKRKNYADKEMEIMEFADQELEKPIFTKNLSYISNHMSQLEGIAVIRFVLNEDNVPALQLVYCKDITSADKVWEHLCKETWNIVYGKDDVRPTPAKWKFNQMGIIK